jgi:hypothetical protein
VPLGGREGGREGGRGGLAFTQSADSGCSVPSPPYRTRFPVRHLMHIHLQWVSYRKERETALSSPVRHAIVRYHTVCTLYTGAPGNARSLARSLTASGADKSPPVRARQKVQAAVLDRRVVNSCKIHPCKIPYVMCIQCVSYREGCVYNRRILLGRFQPLPLISVNNKNQHAVSTLVVSSDQDLLPMLL